ncbi:MAG TPA: protein kinase [Chthoniobacterales bacterium]
MIDQMLTCRICRRELDEGATGGICPACLLEAALADDNDLDGFPESFSNFEILKHEDGSAYELGRGAMGITYKALDKSLKCPVALKMIQSSLLDRFEVRERFFQEARAAARLQHPNVASVYRLESEGTNAYYVMEYVDGETLEAVVRRRGRLPVRMALDIASQVTRALAAADRHGMVHRDIKPSNIMLVNGEADDLRVKVIDFGLAKLRTAPLDLTQGHFIGTPQFASPEQFEGGDVDIRADIFALGMTLWYMLIGRAPVVSEPETTEAANRADFELPWEQLRHLPRPVRRLLEKLLAREPAQRLQNPMLALLAIEECRRGLPGEGRKSRWIWPALAASVAAACALAYFQFLRRPGIPVDASVAVLPFENLSGKAEEAWFANSLTNEITEGLSRIPSLKIASPSSTQRLAKSDKNLKEVAHALGVSTVLEGSAFQVGSKFKISTRLIDAATNQILTATSYQREMEQIFEVERQIALDISKAFRKRLDPKQATQLKQPPTDDIAAYNYYLHGKDHYFRFERDANERAITSFKKAIELDRDFALAHAMLANAYVRRAASFGMDRKELDNAEASAHRALDIDPDLVYAHEALGSMYVYRGSFKKALEAFKIAVRLDPDKAGSTVNIGYTSMITGHLDETLQWYQKGIDLDPTSGGTYNNLGDLYVSLGEYTKAYEAYQSANDLDPNQPDAKIGIVRIYLLKGNKDVARREVNALLRSDPTVTWVRNMAAQVALFSGDFAGAHDLYSSLLAENRSGDLLFSYGYVRYLTALAAIEVQRGNRNDAVRLLVEAERLDKEDMRLSPEHPAAFYDLAAVEAIRGNNDAAVELLRSAIEKGVTDYISLGMDPRFVNLRTDARFPAMIDALKDRVVMMHGRVIGKGTKPKVVPAAP